MAQLPPKPSLWRTHWFQRVIAIVGLLVLAGAVLLWVRVLEPAVLADGSVNANTWVGLFGSVISAMLGGLAAVGVLLLTLRSERRKRAEEDQRRIVEQRLDLVDKLGDLVGTLTLNGGISIPEISVKAQQARRLVRKIDRTWPDQHDGRHVSIALFNGVQAYQEVVDTGLTDEKLKWIRNQLFPAIENLTNSMAHRDPIIVGTDATALLKIVETKPTKMS